MAQTARKHVQHAITGFELTKKALYISSQYGIKGVTLNVLLYLTTCYNAKNKYVYPKQKTIAQMISASERSVVRAIQELVKAGLIIVECKYSNKYVFTSKLTGERPQYEKIFTSENMSEDSSKKVTSKDDILSPHDRQQIIETNKPTKEVIQKENSSILPLEDFKILKAYAEKYAKYNIHAYINKLIKDGSAQKIIKDAKQTQANAKAMENFTQENTKKLEFARANAWNPSEEWRKQQREKLAKNCSAGGKNVY